MSRSGVHSVPEVKVDERTRLAPRWRVIVHNDDVTPIDFVISILAGVFALGPLAATRITLEAHRTGVAHVVTLPLEEAEARIEKAHGLARAKRYPLTFTSEPDA